MLNHLTSKPKYAFFDVDDTIISNKSMFSFIKLYFEQFPMTELQHQFTEEIDQLIANDVSWEIANKIYYSYFKYFPIASVTATCQQWFHNHTNNNPHFYHKNVLKTLQKHQSEGTECVFVSGSFRELLQPIADDLGVEHILSINLEREGLLFTGNILPPQTIGSGKADAITAFLHHQQADARMCFAYGDDISDVPMLEAVGHPVAVDGGRRLSEYAKTMGWPIMQPN